MPDLARAIVREPGADSPRQYAQRVRRLALAYTVLFATSTIGIGLLVWWGKLYVILTQRSNVETLTLAFLMVFFVYLALLSSRGAWGALRIAYYDGLLPRLGADRLALERRKTEALGPPTDGAPLAGLNVALETHGAPGAAFELPVADAAGSMGTIEVDGAAIAHRPAHHDGSNDLLAFFVHQVNQALRGRGVRARVDVVEWQTIADESTQRYLSLVRFARRLERHLQADELWPKVVLTEADLRQVERRLSEVCPALRSEGFLPDWEYSAEHKLPLIPEPLGLISLSRDEKRVDPVASMGCAAVVVVGAVAALALFALVPPWVPGL